MRILLIGFMIVGIIILAFILALLFIHWITKPDKPCIEKQLSEEYGDDWKSHISEILFDKLTKNTIDPIESTILDAFVDSEAFEKLFNSDYEPFTHDQYLTKCKILLNSYRHY